MAGSCRLWIAVAVAFCTGSQLFAGTIPPIETERLELDFDTSDFRLRIDTHSTIPTGQIQADHLNSSSDLIAREFLDFDGTILGAPSLSLQLVEMDGLLFTVNDALAAETGSPILPLDNLVARQPPFPSPTIRPAPLRRPCIPSLSPVRGAFDARGDDAFAADRANSTELEGLEHNHHFFGGRTNDNDIETSNCLARAQRGRRCSRKLLCRSIDDRARPDRFDAHRGYARDHARWPPQVPNNHLHRR